MYYYSIRKVMLGQSAIKPKVMKAYCSKTNLFDFTLTRDVLEKLFSSSIYLKMDSNISLARFI